MSICKDCVWDWSIVYNKGGPSLALHKTDHWTALVALLVSIPVVMNTLSRLPFGYRLFNKLVGWAWDRTTTVLELELTPEQEHMLNPDSWLIEEDYDNGTTEVQT